MNRYLTLQCHIPESGEVNDGLLRHVSQQQVPLVVVGPAMRPGGYGSNLGSGGCGGGVGGGGGHGRFERPWGMGAPELALVPASHAKLAANNHAYAARPPAREPSLAQRTGALKRLGPLLRKRPLLLLLRLRPAGCRRAKCGREGIVAGQRRRRRRDAVPDRRCRRRGPRGVGGAIRAPRHARPSCWRRRCSWQQRHALGEVVERQDVVKRDGDVLGCQSQLRVEDVR